MTLTLNFFTNAFVLLPYALLLTAFPLFLLTSLLFYTMIPSLLLLRILSLPGFSFVVVLLCHHCLILTVGLIAVVSACLSVGFVDQSFLLIGLSGFMSCL